jgi:hypothetical protein
MVRDHPHQTNHQRRPPCPFQPRRWKRRKEARRERGRKVESMSKWVTLAQRREKRIDLLGCLPNPCHGPGSSRQTPRSANPRTENAKQIQKK